MKVWSHRYSRWLGLGALVLAVAAIAAPTAGAFPPGPMPCTPTVCQLSGFSAAGPLAGGPSLAQLQKFSHDDPVVSTAPPLSELKKFSFDDPVGSTAPPLSELKKFSFDGPRAVPAAPGYIPYVGTAPSAPGYIPYVRTVPSAPGYIPYAGLPYSFDGPRSGPATVPTPHRVPITVGQPQNEPGGVDWPAIGIAAGIGLLLIVTALVLGTERRRRTPANA